MYFSCYVIFTGISLRKISVALLKNTCILYTFNTCATVNVYYCLCILTIGPPINQQFDPFYYVIAGDTFILNCTVPDTFRNPTFSWYRDNHDITTLTRTLASNYASQLYIKKLDPDQHSGRYICAANNKAISATTVIVES